MGTIMRWAFMGIPTAIFVWSQAIADELPDCKKIRNAGKKMECLQNSIAILQKQATGIVVQMGSKAFGQNQSDSPNWSLQDARWTNELDVASHILCAAVCSQTSGVCRRSRH
jgi:hypothetical protein